MGKKTKQGEETGLGGTIALCIIILALAVVPYICFPVKPFESREETTGVARAEAAAPTPDVHSGSSVNPSSIVEEPKTSTEASAATDPVTDVIRRIKHSDFRGLDSVMTGRYLKAYEETHEPVLVDSVDLDHVRLHSRGDDWIFLEAPYRSESEWHADAIPWEDSEGTVRMRMVRRGGEWKLENVKIQTRR